MTAITGISSRLGNIEIGVQSGKGSAATAGAAGTVRAYFAAAPSLQPYQTHARYNMTDGSRDPGDNYVSQIGIQGDVPLYAHPELLALLWHAALGGNADSGSADPWTHTATPANDLPYLTIWRTIGGVIFEKFVDCKVDTLTLDGKAGEPLMVTLGIKGITATFGTDEAGSISQTAPYLYMHGAGALKVDATAYPMHAINLQINNNLNAFQADDYVLNNIDPQAREITGSYSLRFSSATAEPLGYRQYFYGGTKASFATTCTGANNDLDFTAKQGGTLGNSIRIAYVDPAIETATESVTVSGRDITVTLRSVSSVLSTANQVIAAIRASAADALVDVALHSTDTGATSVTAFALGSGALAGGLNDGTAQVTGFTFHALDFKFTHTTSLRDMQITIPRAKWADVPVQPDPGGNVIEVQCAFEAERNWSSATEGSIVTVVTRDGNTTA